MKKNSILRIAERVSKALGVILLVILVFEVLILLTGLIAPDFLFQWLKVQPSGNLFFSTNQGNSGSPNDLTESSLWSISLKFILLIFQTYVFWRISKIALTITQSIKSFTTFNLQNAKSFKKLGNLVLVIFALQLIEILPEEDGGFQITLGLQFGPLLMALVFYILAEVFKEGNKLQEEQNLTI